MKIPTVYPDLLLLLLLHRRHYSYPFEENKIKILAYTHHWIIHPPLLISRADPAAGPGFSVPIDLGRRPLGGGDMVLVVA